MALTLRGTKGSKLTTTEMDNNLTYLDTKLGIEVVSTFSNITNSTKKRLIYVITDESNNNDSSLYIYNGLELKFLQTV